VLTDAPNPLNNTMGLSDPYLLVSLGKKTVSTRDQHVATHHHNDHHNRHRCHHNHQLITPMLRTGNSLDHALTDAPNPLNNTMGLSDPYLLVSLGKKTVSTRDQHVDDRTEVDLYQLVEFDTSIPGDTRLDIKVGM
jgi:hypothetical protein